MKTKKTKAKAVIDSKGLLGAVIDGISMVPHESSETANAVYFEVHAPGTEMTLTASKPVGSPLYLDAGGNKYAIHLLELTQAPPKILTLKIEKKTR